MDLDRIKLLFISGCPGLGQIFNGETKKGVFLLTSFILLIVVFVHWVNVDYNKTTPTLVLFPFFLGLYLYSFIDSVFIGYKKNEYKLSKGQEEDLEKILYSDGSEVKQVQASPPVPEGGFKRKVKGTPKIKPFDPID